MTLQFMLKSVLTGQGMAVEVTFSEGFVWKLLSESVIILHEMETNTNESFSQHIPQLSSSLFSAILLVSEQTLHYVRARTTYILRFLSFSARMHDGNASVEE